MIFYGVGSNGTPKARFIQSGFFYYNFAKSKENPLTGFAPINSFIVYTLFSEN